MRNWKTWAVIGGVIGALLVACLILPKLVENRAIDLEEATTVSLHQVRTEEKRRLDLIDNLVDCVKEYDKYEASVLQDITKKRAGSLNPDSVSTRLVAVAESYPDLKSNENYKDLMLELTRTENKIAQARSAYNNMVANYHRHLRRFPANWFLDIVGYEAVPFEVITFNAPVDAPQNLFAED